jgi:energy-converting hydrogenase Eha subunit E
MDAAPAARNAAASLGSGAAGAVTGVLGVSVNSVQVAVVILSYNHPDA